MGRAKAFKLARRYAAAVLPGVSPATPLDAAKVTAARDLLVRDTMTTRATFSHRARGAQTARMLQWTMPDRF